MNCDEMYKDEVILEEFHILFPIDVFPMNEAVAQIKYPLKNRPKVIYTNKDASIDYKFSFLDIATDPSMLEMLLLVLKQQIKKNLTGMEIFETNIFMNNGLRFGWFDYSSPAVDCTIYNICFITWINGRVLEGFFSCPYLKAHEMRNEFIDLLYTIKEVDKNE